MTPLNPRKHTSQSFAFRPWPLSLIVVYLKAIAPTLSVDTCWINLCSFNLGTLWALLAWSFRLVKSYHSSFSLHTILTGTNQNWVLHIISGISKLFSSYQMGDTWIFRDTTARKYQYQYPNMNTNSSGQIRRRGRSPASLWDDHPLVLRPHLRKCKQCANIPSYNL